MEVAKLFTSGNSQAVRLPKEFRFRGDRVYIKKMGNAVVLLPHGDPWQPLVDGLALFTDDFMAAREQGKPQEREEPFE